MGIVKQKKNVFRYTQVNLTKKSKSGLQEKKDQSVTEKIKDKHEHTKPMKYWPIFNQTKVESESKSPNSKIGSVCRELKVVVDREDCKKKNFSTSPNSSSCDKNSKLCMDSQQDNPEDEPVINMDKLLSDLTFGCCVRDYPVINASKLLNDLIFGCYVDLEQIGFGGIATNSYRRNRKFESPRFGKIFESEECFTKFFQQEFSMV